MEKSLPKSGLFEMTSAAAVLANSSKSSSGISFEIPFNIKGKSKLIVRWRSCLNKILPFCSVLNPCASVSDLISSNFHFGF